MTEPKRGDEVPMLADKGFDNAQPDSAFKTWGVMHKAPIGGNMNSFGTSVNRIIARDKKKIEYLLRTIKPQYGYLKARNTCLAQLSTLVARHQNDPHAQDADVMMAKTQKICKMAAAAVQKIDCQISAVGS